MQKKYLILPVILSLSFFLFAGPPDTLWTRTYGGVRLDCGRAVQQTSDGGFIITGTIFIDSTENREICLIRTNAQGDVTWIKTYGKSDSCHNEGYSVKQTNDSGFIIAGATWPSATLSDVYVIRTDSNGDTLWTRIYGGDSLDAGRSVQQTDDEGFIIAGHTRSFGAGYEDVYLIRTNSIGDTLWTKTYGGQWYDYALSIQQTSDKGFIIAGSTGSFGAGLRDAYLIRTNSNGDTLWTKTYGGDIEDQGYSLDLTNDEGFIITGETASFGDGSNDVYLIRTNSNGDTVWSRIYCTREYSDDKGYSVKQTNDGGFIIVGTSSVAYRDVYVIKTNERGDTLWTKTIGGEMMDDGYSIQQTSDDGFIIVGQTYSFGEGGDIYLIRLDKDTTAIQEEIPSNQINPNNFIVSSNHGKIYIRYALPYSSPVKLEAYDIKGKLVKVLQDKFMQKGSYIVNWDSKKFGSGVYFIKLSANGSAVSKKFSIIK